MNKRIALSLPAFILLISCGLIAGLNTQTGSRWLITSILSALPARVSVEHVEGTLFNEIKLRQLHYRTETETIDIDRIGLIWRASELLAGHLKIVELNLEGVDIEIKPGKTSKTAGFDWNADLPMPLQLIVDKLTISKLHYKSGDSNLELQHLNLSALTEQNRLRLLALSLAAPPFRIQAAGDVMLGKQFPFNLKTHWQFDTATYGQWQAETDLHGNAEQLRFESHQSAPFALELRGDISALQSTPNLDIQGDWKHLSWPLATDKPRLFSASGHFDIKGSADDYHITLAGPLTQDYLPQAELRFNGAGSTKAIAIKELQIASTAGAFQLNGRIDWSNATTFNIYAKGQDFNPAIFVAELPGKLNFDSHLNATLADDSIRIDADLGKISGRLRDQAVEAQGQIKMVNETIAIAGLSIRTGRNRIEVDGQLDPVDSDLKFKLTAPALATLWPDLAGSLKGDGQVLGDWRNPSVRLSLSGSHIELNDNSIDKLKLELAYRHEHQTKSKLSLEAYGIQSGTEKIDSLILTGDGDLQSQRFDLSMQSTMATLVATVSGGRDKRQWLGNLQRLTLARPDTGNWALSHPSAIQLSIDDSGINASLARSCLNQMTAAICVASDYRSNGDLDAQLNADSLLLSSLQAFLPGSPKLEGVLNADARLSQIKGELSGRYRIEIPAGTRVHVESASEIHDLKLGRLTLAGQLQDRMLSTDGNLELTNHDYLEAHVGLAVDSPQTLSGRIRTSIRNLEYVGTLIPELSAVKGSISGDLNIEGTLSKPLASGYVHLGNASADIADLGLSLKEVELRLETSTEAPGKLIIMGGAKSGDGVLNIQGFTDLQGNADIQLQGNDFEAAKLPEAQVALSPDLRLIFSETAAMISGRLNIPKALVKLAQLPENAVSVSEDETIIGQTKPDIKSAPKPNLNADIDIVLGKQVSFSGFGLDTDLLGRLKLLKSGQQTGLHGTIDMKKGFYKSYGQELTIRKGRLLFNGPMDAPWLNVEATRLSKSGDITAVLSLNGPLKTPKTRVYSEPALPESEALAYLVTGSPLSQVGKSDGNLLASAALSYGSGQLSWLKEKFGVDEFEVKQGTTLKDTLVAVGHYLTEDFYVGTKLGIFNKQAVLVLKHKLGKSFNVETQSGTSQRIKLNYEIDTN